MTGVRFGELGFEGRCETCKEWLPLDTEFWPARVRCVHVCRACFNDAARLWPCADVERRRAYKRDWMRAYRRRAA
jgi:hypothetical protein